MKKKLHKKFKLSKLKIQRLSMLLFAFFLAVTAITALTFKASAATALFYLNPDTVSVIKGNNFTLDIRLDTAEQNVDGVDVRLDYETANLQYVSTSTSGSAFGSEIVAPSGGSGTVKMTLGTFSSANGDVLIAKVTFKALVDSGDSLVSVNNDSNAVSGPAYINPDKQDANIVFTKPPTQPIPDDNNTSKTPPDTTPTPSTSTNNTSTDTNNTNTKTNTDNKTTDTSTEVTPNEAVPDYYSDLNSVNTASSGNKKASKGLIANMRLPLLITGATLATVFGALFIASMVLHKNSFGELIGIFKRRRHAIQNANVSNLNSNDTPSVSDMSSPPTSNIVHPGDNPDQSTSTAPIVTPTNTNPTSPTPPPTEPKIIAPDPKDKPS